MKEYIEPQKQTLRTRNKVLSEGSITEFQRKVYLALLEVPRGSTITYRELGQRIGCKSAQAIGQALRRNPFAPDVPCHRVIRSDGSVGGFMGKSKGQIIEKKLMLLAEEGVTFPRSKTVKS